MLRAIGFKGVAVPGLPFDAGRGVVPSADGRVLREGQVLPGHYVTGWIRRGPRGIIGTNKKCARDTVRALLADASAWEFASFQRAEEAPGSIARLYPQLV